MMDDQLPRGRLHVAFITGNHEIGDGAGRFAELNLSVLGESVASTSSRNGAERVTDVLHGASVRLAREPYGKGKAIEELVTIFGSGLELEILANRERSTVRPSSHRYSLGF